MTSTGMVALELGDGFRDDEVAVLVDDREVWRHRGVTTNYSVGIAEVVRLQVPAAGAQVQVRVRGRTASAHARGGTLRADVDRSGTPHLDEAQPGEVY